MGFMRGRIKTFSNEFVFFAHNRNRWSNSYLMIWIGQKITLLNNKSELCNVSMNNQLKMRCLEHDIFSKVVALVEKFRHFNVENITSRPEENARMHKYCFYTIFRKIYIKDKILST